MLGNESELTLAEEFDVGGKHAGKEGDFREGSPSISYWEQAIDGLLCNSFPDSHHIVEKRKTFPSVSVLSFKHRTVNMIIIRFIALAITSKVF